MVILVTVLLTCTYIVVGMRLWARLVVARNGGIDDALIAFTMVPWSCFDIPLLMTVDPVNWCGSIFDIRLVETPCF
jgi:hypothetical protein